MSIANLSLAANRPIEEYNPDDVAGAVNSLQAVGKQPALAAIEELLATPDPGEHVGLFWVLRVLFELPPGTAFPPVRLGQPTIPPPANGATLPRFPIVMAHDVPLLAIRGYLLGGLPETVAEHVAFFRAYGVVRSRLLAPSADVGAVEGEFVRQWRVAYGPAHLSEALETIRPQLQLRRG